MFLRVGYELVFDVPAPTVVMALLCTHPSRAPTLRRPDRLRAEPDIPVEEFTDWFGNRCSRLVAPAGKLRLWNDTVVEDSGQPDPVHLDARQHPVEELPPEALRYLFASRYCEVDKLSDVAWQLFGETLPGWPRVQALCDWV